VCLSRVPSLILALACAGCMTIDTLSNRGYRGPYAYSGARADLDLIGQTFLAFNLPFMLLFMLDLPFSAVADTFALPFTWPRERRRLAEIEQRQRVDVEQPPLVEPRAGESPESIAERLVERCRSAAKKLEEELLDCYSVGARIALRPADGESGSPRRLTGSAYKLELRRSLEHLRYVGNAFDWTEPEYEREGHAVRVTVVRSTAGSATTHTQRWLVGPCADGGWRILEEEGIELPLGEPLPAAP
jgi:uncharacterized protein YceK